MSITIELCLLKLYELKFGLIKEDCLLGLGLRPKTFETTEIKVSLAPMQTPYLTINHVLHKNTNHGGVE